MSVGTKRRLQASVTASLKSTASDRGVENAGPKYARSKIGGLAFAGLENAGLEYD